MIHYILADQKRITRRIPVLVFMVLIMAVLVIMFLGAYYTQDWNSIAFGRILQLFLNYAPIFVGLFVFISVFAGGATLFYLALSTGILRQLFDVLFQLKYIEALHLDQMQFKALSEKAYARLANDVFDARGFLGIAAIIVGAVLITMLVFRKRELEF